MCGPVMVILTGRAVKADTVLNSSTRPRSILSRMRSLQVAAGERLGGPVMLIVGGRAVNPDTVLNSSTRPRSILSRMRSLQVAAGWKTSGSLVVIGRGLVEPWNAGIFCQK